MDETNFTILCNESLDENINIKSNNSMTIDRCNDYSNYTNHTDLYVESE